MTFEEGELYNIFLDWSRGLLMKI